MYTDHNSLFFAIFKEPKPAPDEMFVTALSKYMAPKRFSKCYGICTVKSFAFCVNGSFSPISRASFYLKVGSKLLSGELVSREIAVFVDERTLIHGKPFNLINTDNVESNL